MSVRTQVVIVCLCVLIGIAGYSLYRHRNHQRSLVSGGIQNASCLDNSTCGGAGATCATAGYTQQRRFADQGIYYCNDLGHNGKDSKCSRTGSPILEIGFPTNGPYHVNTPVPVNFSVVNFGSGDLVTKTPQGNWMQGGRIDWGDGLGAHAYQITGGAPFSTTYTFHQIGSTTIQAMSWAQFKYQGGNDNGSYESCVDSTATLKIVP
jgi:hypothetical protein